MLDPKQFWAQPTGEMPDDMKAHLDKAHAIVQQQSQGAPLPLDPALQQYIRMMQALGAATSGAARVTTDQIADWEKKHRVKLPKLLTEVFQLQDGGMVQDTEVYINVLSGIQPIVDDGDGDEFEEYYKEEFAEPRLVFELGHDGGEGRYLLDYNARGPGKEPAVCLEFRDCAELDKAAESVDEFFRDLLVSSDGPEVDWSETARLTVIARQQLDLSDHYGLQASVDQILCRDGNSLILFVHRDGRDEETLTRTLLPEPLSTEVGLGASSVRPLQPDRTDIWTLHLQPRNTDGIVQVESTRTSQGRWKNRTSHGVPIYESIWSRDRDRLKQLRAELLGKAEAARVQEEDDSELELQQKLLALPPEAQHAAFMEMFHRGVAEQERFFAEMAPDLGEPPPEIAGLMESLQGKLGEAMRRAREHSAQHPVDPELQKLIEKNLKRRRPDVDE